MNEIDMIRYFQDIPLLVSFVTGLLLGRKFTYDTCANKHELEKLSSEIKTLHAEMTHLTNDIKQIRLDIHDLSLTIKQFETDIKSGAI